MTKQATASRETPTLGEGGERGEEDNLERKTTGATAMLRKGKLELSKTKTKNNKKEQGIFDLLLPFVFH